MRHTLKTELIPFALQAGGSHYPDVNPQQLELYTKLILEEVFKICEQGQSTQTTSTGVIPQIKSRFGL